MDPPWGRDWSPPISVVMGDEARTTLEYGRPMGTVRTLAARIQALGPTFPVRRRCRVGAGPGHCRAVSLAVTYGGASPCRPHLQPGFTLAVVASMLGITLPLAWRRRYPFSVGVVVVVAFLLARIVVHVPEANVSLLAAWLMIYSVAASRSSDASGHPSLPCVSPPSWPSWSASCFSPAPSTAAPLARCFSLLYNVVVIALPWLLGAAIWSLRDRQRKLAEQTVELQAEREENARQAVFAERVRIARELHDVVAHHVSVIGVQAAGARRVMERQPARAAEALSSIEASSRQAVVELHRLLGFLRRAPMTSTNSPPNPASPSWLTSSPRPATQS